MNKFITPLSLTFLISVTLLFSSCSKDELAAPVITSIEPTQGSIGSTVTITGSNFERTKSTVTFNGVKAQIKTGTRDQLVVTVPTSETGVIAVKTSGGRAEGSVFTYQSGDKSIQSFVVGQYPVSISGTQVTIRIPALTDVSSLSPVIIVHESATISPASGEAQDFTNEVTYRVTAEDNSTVTYTVSVVPVYGLKSLELTNGFQAYNSTINQGGFEITANLKFGIIRSNLSLGNKINLQSVLENGFTTSQTLVTSLDNPEDLVITAPNGVIQRYSFIFKNEDNYLTGINLFNDLPTTTTHRLFSYPEDVVGLPNDSFVVWVLSNKNLSNVVPINFYLSERATTLPGMATPVNFNSDFVYEVVSESGLKRPYTIRVLKRDLLFVNESTGTTIGVSNTGAAINMMYKSVSPIVGVELVNTANGNVVECTFTFYVSDGHDHLSVLPKQAFPAGNYRMRVTLGNGNIILMRAVFGAS